MITVSVKSDIDKVLRELDGKKAGARKAIAAALNRVANTVGSVTARKVTEVFNVGLRDVRPYVKVTGASARTGALVARIAFRIKAIPPQLFKPRVKMERITITRKDGSTFSRKLPVVYFKRYRQGGYKKLPGVFPLHTRRTGRIPPGDKLVRRIGPDRNKLTQLRFYIMPPSFVRDVLMPEGKRVVGARFVVEFRSAYRKFSGRLVP